MNIALLAPFKNAASETFIQAHKERLSGNIFFYYGDNSFSNIENRPPVYPKAIASRLHTRLVSLLSDLNFTDFLLYTSFRKNKIQVVFAEYGTSGAQLVNICRKLKLPLIVHFHGYDAYVRTVIDQHKDSYARMFQYAFGVVAVSNHMRSNLLKLGCSGDKIVLNPYGPHSDFFNVSHSKRLHHFIALGRFVEKKAPYYLIMAFEKVLKEFPGALLTIGGEGPLLGPCKHIVAAKGLENSIFMPGKLTRQAFLALLKNSLAFLQHSITATDGDCEGTPVAILEAMAAGIAIISTRHTGIQEVVFDNETGLLVEEHDVWGMADNMLTLLRNNDLAEQMGKKARARITDSFTMERHIEKLDELISRSLN